MKTMVKEPLIKGVFTPEQANEVLSALFRKKIQMHSLSSFSNYIKKGKESRIENSRQQQLTESLERLVNCMKTITDPELKVMLDCVVKMKFVKRKSKSK